METPTTIPPGTRVTHPTWGTGTVTKQYGLPFYLKHAIYVHMDNPTGNVRYRYCLPTRLTINAGDAT